MMKKPGTLTIPIWLRVAFFALFPYFALLRVPQMPAQAGTTPRQLQIAAAADLSFAMEEILKEFRSIHPDILVRVSYGSSGNFFSQLSNHAPFDMFFSADTTYPRRLVEQGAAFDGAVFSYAVGRLVLWVPNTSAIDLKRLGIEVLRSERIRHIAIANPKHAPYGVAAEAYLRSEGLYDTVRPKLVYGENVAQALQFVQSGAAEIGLIACALAEAPDVKSRGQFWEVPRDKYPRMEQAGIILKWTKDPSAAAELRSFFLSGRAREILIRFGFYLPGD
jgi:molybdate transport system substrate-binding protein